MMHLHFTFVILVRFHFKMAKYICQNGVCQVPFFVFHFVWFRPKGPVRVGEGWHYFCCWWSCFFLFFIFSKSGLELDCTFSMSERNVTFAWISGSLGIIAVMPKLLSTHSAMNFDMLVMGPILFIASFSSLLWSDTTSVCT